MAAAAYIYIHYCFENKKKRYREGGGKRNYTYATRNVNIGATLLSDLEFQIISGQYKNLYTDKITFAFCADGNESWYAKTCKLNSKGNALLLWNFTDIRRNGRAK